MRRFFIFIFFILLITNANAQTIEGISNIGSLNFSALNNNADNFIMTPDELNFGQVEPGTAKLLYFYLVNNSGSDLTIVNITKPLGPGSRFFNIITDFENEIIPPGGNLSLGISFMPESSRLYNTSFSVICNNTTKELFVQGEGQSQGSNLITLATMHIYLSINSITSISVKWDKVDGAVNYFLYRNTSPTSDGELIYEGPSTGIIDTDEGFIAGDTYYYKIRVESTAGLSDYSTTASLTIPDDSQTEEKPLPDLRPVAVTVDNENWESGTFQNVNVQVYNAGQANSGDFYGNLYLSKTKEISGWDIPLYPQFRFTSVQATQFGDFQSVRIKVPDLVVGDYYLGVSVNKDLLINESSVYQNNYKLSNQKIRIEEYVANDLPDIKGEVNFLSDEWVIGNQGAVEIKVRNINSAPYNAEFKCNIWLSKNKFLDNTDLLLSSWTENIPLYEKTKTIDDFTFPETIESDNYYIIFELDTENDIVESNDENNVVVGEKSARFNSGQNKIRISGRIVDMNDNGVENAILEGFPGVVKTDSYGFYETYVPNGFSGIVRPRLRVYDNKGNQTDEYFFDAVEYENVTTSISNPKVKTFRISETIKTTLKYAGRFPVGTEGEKLRSVFKDAYPELVKKTSQALDVLGEIEDYYNIFNSTYSQYGDINNARKAFKLMVKITKKIGPIGKIASTYIEIGDKALEEYEKVLGNLKVRDNFKSIQLDLKVQNKSFFNRRYLHASEFTVNGKLNWLKVTLIAYLTDENGEIVYDPLEIPCTVEQVGYESVSLVGDFFRIIQQQGARNDLKPIALLRFEFIQNGANNDNNENIMDINKNTKVFYFPIDDYSKYLNPVADLTNPHHYQVVLQYKGIFETNDLSKISFKEF